MVSYGALVCRQGPARIDESSVRLGSQGCSLQALHVFDGSRSAMASICTGYIERDTTRRQKMSGIVVVAIMLPRF